MINIASLLAVASVASAAVIANNSTLTINTPTAVAKECSFSDFTASDSKGVASINACATPVGNVAIAGKDIATVDLSNVRQYYGDIKVNGTDVTSFNAPNLQLVSGELSVTNNHILSYMNLAQLSTINSLRLTALPRLESLGLTTGITTAKSIIISDTGLKKLEGINVYSLEIFNVNNNAAITNINSGLQQVTESLIITDNDEAVVSMKQLTAVKDLTLGKVSNFTFGNLTHINGSVAISQSYMDTIDLSQIQSINNSLTIFHNNNLTLLNVSSLKTLGGALQISENKKLSSFKGSFASLENVGGSITINGTFNNGSFEGLKQVAGGFSLISTDGELTCDEFNKLNKDGDIKGDHFVCSGSGVASSSTGASRPTSAVGGGSGSSLSKNSTTTKKSDGHIVKQSSGLFAIALVALTTIVMAL